jgi:hypothetical protein
MVAASDVFGQTPGYRGVQRLGEQVEHQRQRQGCLCVLVNARIGRM